MHCTLLFLQPFVADLLVAEEVLDQVEGIFHARANLRLDLVEDARIGPSTPVRQSLDLASWR